MMGSQINEGDLAFENIRCNTENHSRRSKKRNKPTLNCLECVERKTRCDRQRPSCFSCTRRQTQCQYTAIANIIAEAGTNVAKKRARTDHESSDACDPSSRPSPSLQASMRHTVVEEDAIVVNPFGISIPDEEALLAQQINMPLPSDCNVANMSPMFAHTLDAFSPLLVPPPLSAPLEWHALLNLFGTNSEHPFQNYWTDDGGLVEIISSLPEKPQADTLVKRYFEIVDPLYPIVARDTFVAEFERFWRLSEEEKHREDPAAVALQFAVYATAAQDTGDSPIVQDHEKISEFYLSCCHQSLCISSYLNRCSITTVQTLILICHFLIACNKIADAWTIAGITQRQVYGLRLNRKPEDGEQGDEQDDVQIRYRLWQAVMFQDTSLSLQMSLPPTTMYHSLEWQGLQQPEDASAHGLEKTDVFYVQAMWQYSEFVQTHLCVPRSREQPLGLDAAHKQQVIARFRHLLSTWDEPFRQFGPDRFDNAAPRLLYQMVTLASNYFYAFALLCLDADERTGTDCDALGVISSCHEGMLAFFALVRLCPGQANEWGATHNRTFGMAIMLGTLVPLQQRSQQGVDDPLLMQGRGDLDQYIRILERAHGSPEYERLQLKRLANLRVLQANG